MSLLNQALIAAARECDAYRKALEHIANLPGGSRGAYGKFADAQLTASEVLRAHSATGDSNG